MSEQVTEDTAEGADVSAIPRTPARHRAKRDEPTLVERKHHTLGKVGIWDISVETTVYSNGARRSIVDVDTQWWDDDEIDGLIARLTEAKNYIAQEGQ
jgi:hypothetical protein